MVNATLIKHVGWLIYYIGFIGPSGPSGPTGPIGPSDGARRRRLLCEYPRAC